MVSPKVCDAQLRAHSRNETVAISHAKPATLAIRLLWNASFQKKIASTHRQKSNEKAPASGRFRMFQIGRVRGKF
jgi:hypothetical protein